jgi:hypothetical protein
VAECLCVCVRGRELSGQDGEGPWNFPRGIKITNFLGGIKKVSRVLNFRITVFCIH